MLDSRRQRRRQRQHRRGRDGGSDGRRRAAAMALMAAVAAPGAGAAAFVPRPAKSLLLRKRLGVGGGGGGGSGSIDDGAVSADGGHGDLDRETPLEAYARLPMRQRQQPREKDQRPWPVAETGPPRRYCPASRPPAATTTAREARIVGPLRALSSAALGLVFGASAPAASSAVADSPTSAAAAAALAALSPYQASLRRYFAGAAPVSALSAGVVAALETQDSAKTQTQTQTRTTVLTNLSSDDTTDGPGTLVGEIRSRLRGADGGKVTAMGGLAGLPLYAASGLDAALLSARAETEAGGGRRRILLIFGPNVGIGGADGLVGKRDTGACGTVLGAYRLVVQRREAQRLAEKGGGGGGGGSKAAGGGGDVLSLVDNPLDPGRGGDSLREVQEDFIVAELTRRLTDRDIDDPDLNQVVRRVFEVTYDLIAELLQQEVKDAILRSGLWDAGSGRADDGVELALLGGIVVRGEKGLAGGAGGYGEDYFKPFSLTVMRQGSDRKVQTKDLLPLLNVGGVYGGLGVSSASSKASTDAAARKEQLAESDRKTALEADKKVATEKAEAEAKKAAAEKAEAEAARAKAVQVRKDVLKKEGLQPIFQDTANKDPPISPKKDSILDSLPLETKIGTVVASAAIGGLVVASMTAEDSENVAPKPKGTPADLPNQTADEAATMDPKKRAEATKAAVKKIDSRIEVLQKRLAAENEAAAQEVAAAAAKGAVANQMDEKTESKSSQFLADVPPSPSPEIMNTASQDAYPAPSAPLATEPAVDQPLATEPAVDQKTVTPSNIQDGAQTNNSESAVSSYLEELSSGAVSPPPSEGVSSYLDAVSSGGIPPPSSAEEINSMMYSILETMKLPSYIEAVQEVCDPDEADAVEKCAPAITKYIDAISSGAESPNVEGTVAISSYLDALASNAADDSTAGNTISSGPAVSSYLDNVSSGTVSAPSSDGVSSYLDALSSGEVQAPTTSSSIPSYMDALLPSKSTEKKSYLDAMTEVCNAKDDESIEKCAPAMTNYLDAVSSGTESPVPAGTSAISSYLDALSDTATSGSSGPNAPSEAPMSSYLDAMKDAAKGTTPVARTPSPAPVSTDPDGGQKGAQTGLASSQPKASSSPYLDVMKDAAKDATPLVPAPTTVPSASAPAPFATGPAGGIKDVKTDLPSSQPKPKVFSYLDNASKKAPSPAPAPPSPAPAPFATGPAGGVEDAKTDLPSSQPEAPVSSYLDAMKDAAKEATPLDPAPAPFATGPAGGIKGAKTDLPSSQPEAPVSPYLDAMKAAAKEATPLAPSGPPPVVPPSPPSGPVPPEAPSGGSYLDDLGG